jgi:hypothetical protein
MARPSKREALIRNARQGQPFDRVEVPRTTCERCRQDGIYALPDGTPRPHLRPAIPGEELYSELVPVRVSCE